MFRDEIWFGNGTTALSESIRGVGCQDLYIAVQASVCPQVIAAILSTGNKRYFIDIEPDSLGLDPSVLEEIIDEVGAVMAVHSQGRPCRIEAIKALCVRHGKYLIEGCAQAEGAQVDGTSVGAFGDISIFSSGTGKVPALGGGGSAYTEPEQFAPRLREFEVHESDPIDAEHAPLRREATAAVGVPATAWLHRLAASV